MHAKRKEELEREKEREKERDILTTHFNPYDTRPGWPLGGSEVLPPHITPVVPGIIGKYNLSKMSKITVEFWFREIGLLTVDN